MTSVIQSDNICDGGHTTYLGDLERLGDVGGEDDVDMRVQLGLPEETKRVGLVHRGQV